ncbi:MAG: hypothetical protein FWG10_07855 [Eubacteriaceae bacterium]|nr:hypothetical protein [Eubacteriaceae bacterium]
MADDKLTLLEERRQSFIDAISFNEPKKVPIGAEILMWPFSSHGGTYLDVMGNPDATVSAYTAFMDEVPLDYIAMGVGVSHSVTMHKILGSKAYTISSDGTTLQHMQSQLDFISVEDYQKVIDDLYGFMSEEWIQKNYPALNVPDKAQAYASLKEAAIEYKKFVETNDRIRENVFGDRQKLNFYGPETVRYSSNLNTLFDNLRGIPNTLLDIRRRPEIVDAACQAIFASKAPLPDPKDYIGKPPLPLGSTVYHSECFLSPPLFDKYFFNDFRKLYMPYMEAGVKFFVKGEGHFLNTIDRYRSIPKGSCVFMLDEDDAFEVHKAIGDWQVIGAGITADLLRFGDVQKCKDYVSKCFDTFAPGGGFIFLQNKPLLCGGDASLDVLREVYQFADELSRK